MTESEIQKQIIDYYTDIGALVFRMNAGGRGYNIKRPPAGTPDLFIVLNQKCVWVEVKTKTGKVSVDQLKMHERLNKLGQWVIVARSVDDVVFMDLGGNVEAVKKIGIILK